MIKIIPKKDYLTALESVAMTDIVLNMFIFFFISFSLLYTFNSQKVSKLDIKLPKASSAVRLNGEDNTILSIVKNGSFFIDDEKIIPGNLREALSMKLKENPSMSLLLKVDRSARFDSVSKALDVINKLNIQRVSVAAVRN